MSFLSIIIIIALVYVFASSRYKKTNYYEVTKKPLISVLLDKGYYGEYLIYKYLREYEQDGAKFLYNCYLPKNNGQTTEVDVMMIHQSGIYVFESKNYSGWIFGSEYSKTWTQTLPSGRKSHKEHFLNPIMQNKLHIKWLENQIGDRFPIHSIVVFSERCTFKKIDINSPNMFVIKRNAVYKTVKGIEGEMGVSLQQNQVEQIYEKLYPYTQVADDVKRKHIEDIIEEHTEEYSTRLSTDINEKVSNVVVPEVLFCPRCGGKLVLRVSKRGTYAGSQFYGCSNFPKCRYIRNT